MLVSVLVGTIYVPTNSAEGLFFHCLISCLRLKEEP